MMSTAFHQEAIHDFVGKLRRANLIERGQVEPVVNDFLNKHPAAKPPALAEHLVRLGVLTPFQAERLLKGDVMGFVFGPYTLQEALGSGSMGTVYSAVSRSDQRHYAVKLLPRRNLWNVRLARRQVRAFERINHAAVVPFKDVGTAGSQHYLAWPQVEGEPLDRLVEREGRLSPGAAAYYGLQVAAGLLACHAENLVHGLLKPSNILIDPVGQARILDFGVGAILADNKDDEASMINTHGQVSLLTSGLDCGSPESILDPAKQSSTGDQYSLGCILYFCLTGRYPFEGSAVQKMQAHQLEQPAAIRERSPEVPGELAAIVERMMEKTPEGRFGDMSDVMEALRPWATAPTVRRPITPSPQRPPRIEVPKPEPVARPTPISPIQVRNTVRMTKPILRVPVSYSTRDWGEVLRAVGLVIGFLLVATVTGLLAMPLFTR